MKKLIGFVTIFLSLAACGLEEAEISRDCVYTATVVDLSNLGGCWYVFQLDNGEYLEPGFRYGQLWCGTPPLPPEITEDPLYNFEFIEGQRVRLGFEVADDLVSTCMAGRIVYITCLEVLGETAVGE